MLTAMKVPAASSQMTVGDRGRCVASFVTADIGDPLIDFILGRTAEMSVRNDGVKAESALLLFDAHQPSCAAIQHS